MALSRIKNELKEIRRDPNNLFNAAPLSEDNLFKWEAKIVGPSSTPYEGGIFRVAIKFPENYPFEPPKFTFITKIYHPNISGRGQICLDILKNNWTPVLTVPKLLLSICSLLCDPNPDDPMVPDLARYYHI